MSNLALAAETFQQQYSDAETNGDKPDALFFVSLHLFALAIDFDLKDLEKRIMEKLDEHPTV